jgi:enterochelin esterase-like enzyme
MWGLVLVLLAAVGLIGCEACSAKTSTGDTDAAVAVSVRPRTSATAAARASANAPAPKTTAPKTAAARTLQAKELTLQFEDTPAGALDVVVHIPPRAPGAKLPVLYAFHGRGEALKGPRKGPRGWIDDYWLPKAEARLFAPPLTSQDLIGVSDDAHVEALNARLTRHPYEGVIVVCPFTPDIMHGTRSLDAARDFGKWLVDVLVPRIHHDTPSLVGRAATGIDGVSLGGRLSILVGFEHPRVFGAVGGIQAAFDSAEAARVATRAERAQEIEKQNVRLLTSEGDFYLRATRELAVELKARGVAHRLDVVPGPHAYAFNRGPGVYEMLTFHDRALRPVPAQP